VIKRFEIEVLFDEMSCRARTELKVQFMIVTSFIETFLEF
jgi:hypothetical protein